MPAAPPAAGAALGQEPGGEHEQPAAGVGVTGGPSVEGALVRGQDRRPVGVVGGEPVGMRLGQRPRRQGQLAHPGDGTGAGTGRDRGPCG